MKRIFIYRLFVSLFTLSLVPTLGVGQCENWNDSPRKDEGESAHSIYRQALKNENYQLAFENWKTAYEIAPAADGRRDYHYTDGAKLYKWKYNNADNPDLKDEYRDSVLQLFEQAASCYLNREIIRKSCGNNEACYRQKAGFLLGRKVYEMYYTFNMSRKEIFEDAKRSIELAGDESEYILYDPLAASLVALFKKEKIDAETVRTYHALLKQITASNLEKENQYSQYYESSLEAANKKISKIEDKVYDCEYFKAKLVPQYEEDPENGELVKEIYEKLLDEDCDTSDQIMKELRIKYDIYMKEYNEKVRRELAKTNPNIAARIFYEEGKYKKALDKYEEALDSTNVDEELADYYFSMASILGRKLKRYSEARSKARKAAQYRENWGRPYILIGDLYAAGKCGDPWNQRLCILAALDKYAYAKSIDPDVAGTANRRIANYSGSKPLKSEAFMRGLEEGQVVKVGCWVDENVKLRFSEEQ